MRREAISWIASLARQSARALVCAKRRSGAGSERTIRDVEPGSKPAADLVTGNWRVGRTSASSSATRSAASFRGAVSAARPASRFMDVAGPVLERRAISIATLAARQGAHRPVNVRTVLPHFDYYLKLDIRKYFDSVRHDLLWTVRAHLQGRSLAAVLRYHGSYEPARKACPRSLISQHAASLLEPLDRQSRSN